MSIEPDDPPRRPGTPSEDDLPPTGEEAKARRRQSVAPMIWLALGAVVVAVFLLALLVLHGVAPLPSPGK